MNERIQK